jgi:hypothetical protein
LNLNTIYFPDGVKNFLPLKEEKADGRNNNTNSQHTQYYNSLHVRRALAAPDDAGVR